MTTDYLVASLPTVAFELPAPLSWDDFTARAGGDARVQKLLARFAELETQLKNAQAFARVGQTDWDRPTESLSLYWRNRILAAFQEKDVAKRETLLDRIWWDAAGELTAPTAPLGEGALATYAVRLRIALKRSRISTDAGNAAFDRLTAETKITFS